MNVPAPSTTSNFIGQQNPAYQLQQSGYDLNDLPQVGATGQNITTGINQAGAQPFDQSQLSMLNQLGAQATGQGGPTVAQQQLTSGVNANLASALAAGASSNGLGQNPGNAAKGIQTNLAGINANAAGQAAATRAGEIQSAQGQLGSLALAGGAQAQQAAQAQQQATAQGQMFGATQAQQANEYNTGLAAAQQAQYNQALTGLSTQNQASNNQLENQVLNPSTYLNMVGGAGGALGAVASDESVKTGISAEAATANQFLSALGQYMKPTAAPSLAPLTQTSSGSGGKNPPPPPSGTTQSAGQLAQANAGALTGMPASPVDPTTAALPQPSMLPQSDASYGLNPGDLQVPDGPVPSDERSKDHIDQLTNLAQTLAGAAKGQFPAGSRAWNLQQGNGLTLGAPQPQAQPPPPPPQAMPAQPDAGQPEVVYPPPQPSAPVASADVSDEAEKKLVDGLENHSYQYKDPSMPGAAPGTHFGPMAQELERAGPMGASTVSTGSDGVKRVDTGRLSLALAGALGMLNNKVESLSEALDKAHGKKAKAA